MSKVTLEIEEELMQYFRENIGDSESNEILLAKMLVLLREILETANTY